MKCKIKNCKETTKIPNKFICWRAGFCPKHYHKFIGYEKNYDLENMPFRTRTRKIMNIKKGEISN